MSTIYFEYDATRGGFCLRFGDFDRKRSKSAFSDFVTIFENEDGLISAIESDFGDHGGIPLRKIHQSDETPEGNYQITANEFRSGPLLFRQNPPTIRDVVQYWE